MYKSILSILKKKTQAKISNEISNISKDIYVISKYHHFIHYQASACYFFRGYANIFQNQLDSAKIDFAMAIFQDHNNQDAISSIAILNDGGALSKNIPKIYINKLITEFGYMNISQKNLDDCHYNTAINHYNAQEFKQAICNMLISLKRSCNKYMLHDLSMSYIMNGQYDEAIKYSKLALREDEKYGNAHFSLGLAYLFKKDFIKAKKCLDFAVELLEKKHNEYHKNFSLLFYKRALMYHKLGEIDICLNDLKKAIELDSNNFAALYLYSKLYSVN